MTIPAEAKADLAGHVCRLVDECVGILAPSTESVVSFYWVNTIMAKHIWAVPGGGLLVDSKGVVVCEECPCGSSEGQCEECPGETIERLEFTIASAGNSQCADCSGMERAWTLALKGFADPLHADSVAGSRWVYWEDGATFCDGWTLVAGMACGLCAGGAGYCIRVWAVKNPQLNGNNFTYDDIDNITSFMEASVECGDTSDELVRSGPTATAQCVYPLFTDLTIVYG